MQPIVRNQVYVGEDGILHVICIGDQDETSAREMAEETARIANLALGSIKVLLDTTRAGRFSVEARQAAVESLALARHGKAAVVASSMPARALGLFMVGGAKTQNMKVFETRREALEWLGDTAKERRTSFRSLLRAFLGLRWLRIKEGWIREVFEILGGVAIGDFSRRITVSKHDDELAMIEAGINMMVDDLEEREREAREYQKRLSEERNRLARELHDSVSQLLFSVILNSEAASALVESNPELAKTRIESARAAANEVQEQMRDLLTELRLGPLEEGLIAALKMYVATFKEREGIDTTFSVEGERPIAVTMERELFRIAQEALNNIAKHSQATSAKLELGFYPGSLRLIVEDNGIGFDPFKLGGAGLGLSNMRERAEGLSGRLAIDSAPGKGTRITVEMPLEQHRG